MSVLNLIMTAWLYNSIFNNSQEFKNLFLCCVVKFKCYTIRIFYLFIWIENNPLWRTCFTRLYIQQNLSSFHLQFCHLKLVCLKLHIFNRQKSVLVYEQIYSVVWTVDKKINVKSLAINLTTILSHKIVIWQG